MMTPAARPLITENERPSQFSIPSKYKMTKVATAIRTAATFVPSANEWSKSFIVAPSFVRTRKMPNKERKTPTEAINIGAITALSCMSGTIAKAVAPRAAVERIEPQ